MTQTYSARETAIGIAIFIAIGSVLAWLAGADFSQLTGRGLAASGAILAVYFLPAIVAHWRHHHSASAILLLNLLLGWTVLGWGIAIVWATTTPRRS
jgi:hypothetical protein